MTLYLLRHGVAEDHAPDGTDFGRRLTPDGLAEITRVAAGMQAAGLFPDRVVTSPFARAAATAGPVAAAFGLAVETDDRLGSGAAPAAFFDVVRGLTGARAPLLVGHQPDLGAFVAALTGEAVRVGKGTLVVLRVREAAPGAGEVDRVLPAAALASFAP